MAGMYYRKIRVSSQVPATKLYGFNRVSKTEIAGITTRLSATPTVNYRAHSATTSRFDNLYERVVAVCPHISCEKDDECTCVRAVGGHDAKRMLERRFEKNLSVDRQNKIIQRLQRPTTASSNKSRRPQTAGTTVYEGEDEQVRESSPQMTQQSGEDAFIFDYDAANFSRKQNSTEKLLARLQLPTQTFMQKRWNGRCWYCDCVHPVDIPPEWCKAEEKYVKPEQLVNIVERLKTPICSNGSLPERGPCERYQDIRRFEQQHREHWPLWCGLERSKTVSEIVHRLYNGNEENSDDENNQQDFDGNERQED